MAHTRTSTDKIRKKIFDFALSQQELLMGREQRAQGEEEGRRGKVWMSTASEGLESETQRSVLPQVEREAAVSKCYHSWVVNTKRAREGSRLHWETVSTLRAVLDTSTHLTHYPTPLHPSLARFVVAKRDLYIPRQSISSVEETWPGMSVCRLVPSLKQTDNVLTGCEVKYVKGGHVSATLLQQQAFQ